MRVGRIRGLDRDPNWGPSQFVGVEIELEECNNYPDREAAERYNWEIVGDGSLRGNGYEAISIPTPIEEMLRDIPDHFNVIKDACGGRGSVRTGIHVHFDMLDRTLEEVAAVCTMYSLVEPALFRTLPPDREQCIYCVPWYRAPSEAELLASLVPMESRRTIIDKLSEHGCKYSALNLRSLIAHGTIEFRMAPTFENGVILREWIDLLNRIVQMGVMYGTADAVLGAALDRGLDDMFPDLKDVCLLAEEYDAFYCAEALGSGHELTWIVPELDLDDEVIHVTEEFEEEADELTRFRYGGQSLFDTVNSTNTRGRTPRAPVAAPIQFATMDEAIEADVAPRPSMWALDNSVGVASAAMGAGTTLQSRNNFWDTIRETAINATTPEEIDAVARMLEDVEGNLDSQIDDGF